VPFAVVTMAWRGEHRAFVVEEYIRNGGSVITTQRAFRKRFELGRHDPVPVRKTIHDWVSNFRATGSALKKKSPGRPRT
jgi:transposase